MTFDLIENRQFIPDIKVEVQKEGEVVKTVSLRGKSFYSFGKLPLHDIQMAHRSISRSHATMIVDSQKGVCILDLGSKSGTKINGEKVEAQVPVPLINGAVLQFGMSTRRYLIGIDFSKVEQNFSDKSK